MSKPLPPPPTIDQLNAVNKEMEQLLKQKPPAPQLVPGGSMQSAGDHQRQLIRQKRMAELTEKQEELEARVALTGKAREGFDRIR